MIAHVSVVVPAADEQDLIGRCLRSVMRARARLDIATYRQVSSDVIVVLDECRDATQDVVAAFAEVAIVPTSFRCVGRARAAGCTAATARAVALGVVGDRHWLANTDADSVVPPDWLIRMVALGNGDDGAGVDVVAGTVVPGAELSASTRTAWHAQHDARDGHHHVHGANLGVRASSLAAIGGWAPLAAGEDVDLVQRAVSGGMTVARTGAISVRTSARTHSRIGGGFAGYLRSMAVVPPSDASAAIVPPSDASAAIELA